MTWLHSLNPIPSFPPYTGPYSVGSTDVEIPAAELESPGPSPSPCTNLPTVAFRVFYPCRENKEAKEEDVRWIPKPQREFVGAYARFLGAGNAFSKAFSMLPQLLYYISIPVHHNAELLEPNTMSRRWPVVVFSHGLGGSRNAYSHICGSLASHGMVVFAADHRDGSAPISFVHAADEKLKRVEYKKVSHTASTEVYESRDEQLRIRLWELGLIHDALLKIDSGVALTNVADERHHHLGVKQKHKRAHESPLSIFADKLAVHDPGSISWAGHSFGAATMVQFTKSTFWQPDTHIPDYRPLFTPSKASTIVRQITPSSAVILLDLWTLPIQSPATEWLRKRPMPCYASRSSSSSRPSVSVSPRTMLQTPLIAILSEAFYNWSSNLDATLSVIAKPATAPRDLPGAHVFYPVSSAHLSQSDFGILFPWVTTKVFGAKDPERVLRLNTRAILQVLRNKGVEVARTGKKDLEIEGGVDKGEKEFDDDEKILSTVEGSVRDWVALRVGEGGGDGRKVESGPGEAVYEGEILGEKFGQRQR